MSSKYKAQNTRLKYKAKMRVLIRVLNTGASRVEVKMAKYLVIVESPAKAKTIKKFLGSNYEVMASMGHVRDLPKSTLGIDLENDYEPKYITIRGKGDLIASLKRAAKKADKVYLATDPDREGEAISWHLGYALKLDGVKTSRITFNEITKNAVKESLKNAREIDMNLVDAQQARRCLDRIVGYSISPFLWSKVKRGLSAGRVQSVALRIISDREKEIESFVPKEYYTLDAEFAVAGVKKHITARYYGSGSKKEEIGSKEQLDAILSDIEGKDFKIVSVKEGERKRKAPLPFTTSTLQQEASSALGYATSKTMRIAQQLYEGVDVKGHGTIGLITYLRTDSIRISKEADEAVKEFITDNYGKEYVTDTDVNRIEGKKIQDAHEAIRPTYVDLKPEDVKDSLTREQLRLYTLIWKRFVSSRMMPEKFKTSQVKISAGNQIFTASASVVIFDGYALVYKASEAEKSEDEEPVVNGTFNFTTDTELKKVSLNPVQHFTQPLPHFTEAALVKTLEELGIGRPSTYAPTISTILARHYVTKEEKSIYMTDLGEAVDGILRKGFPIIVDTTFTATLETLLDGVEEGKVKWKNVIRNFYPDFEDALQNAEKNIGTVKVADEVSDVQCELCGKMMVVKYGPHGKFLACPGFPDCRNTKPYLEKIGVTCPKCGKQIVIKHTKKGRKFYGCEGYPECDFVSWQMPTNEKCPKCGKVLLVHGDKLVCSDKECGYVEKRNNV